VPFSYNGAVLTGWRCILGAGIRHLSFPQAARQAEGVLRRFHH